LNPASPRPLNLAIAAIGGQGGGVLANWIAATAERNGYAVQATSVPGVAQRTGATIYYIEMMPPEMLSGQDPVFALNPIPGDLDIVVAAELVEAGRAIQRGFVTPDRTTLIASNHRVYSTLEKSALGDGTLDGQVILDIGTDVAKNFICFDMAEAAERTGSVISAVLLGAVAGCSCLPFSRADFETSIRADGRSVNTNLAGFDAGFALPGAGNPGDSLDITLIDTLGDSPGDKSAVSLPAQAIPDKPTAPAMLELLRQIENKIPEPGRRLAREGLRRVLDYQDIEYGKLYLQRLCSFAEWDRYDQRLCKELARYLALRMTCEDTVRVAELKIRPARFERLRQELSALPNQLVYVTEFMHPRVEEVCDTLPAWLGAYILESATLRGGVSVFCRRGRKINTTRLPGFLLLYMIASLKRWRRGSYRFARENRQIEDWLGRIKSNLPENYDLAVEITKCADLIKGYGDTHARGLANYEVIMRVLDDAVLTNNAADTIRTLRDAALADEEGVVLSEALADFRGAG
jgi:indolepyruvate ferredoxin oxidoreductase beta subunit